MCAHVLEKRKNNNTKYSSSHGISLWPLPQTPFLFDPTHFGSPIHQTRKSCFCFSTTVLSVCLSRVILLEFAARLHQRVLLSCVCVWIPNLKKKTNSARKLPRARDHSTLWKPLRTHTDTLVGHLLRKEKASYFNRFRLTAPYVKFTAQVCASLEL